MGMPVELDRAEFEALVDRALDGIPDELAALSTTSSCWSRTSAGRRPATCSGLYDGVALPSGRRTTPAAARPDPLFRGPLLDFCDDLERAGDEVRITVVHEIAHHFGIDDDRLHDLGYA